MIRTCFPFNFKTILEWNKNKFEGGSSSLANEWINSLPKYGNITLDMRAEDDGVGEKNGSTGLYDGCLGRLQRNESDMMIQLVDYPLDAIETQQGDIVLESKLEFMTVYHPRTMEEKNSVQILSCFKTFDTGVWAMSLSILLLLHLLLIVRRKIFNHFLSDIRRIKCQLGRKKRSERHIKRMRMAARRKNKYYFTQIVTHMTRLGSLTSSKGLLMKMIFFTCSTFSLLVVHYFCSFIKTELVTIQPPELFTSYQDLIDNNVAALFGKGGSTYLKFKFAPSSSPEKKLWDISVAKHGEEKIIMTSNNNLWIEATELMLKRQAIVFLDSTLRPGVVNGICKLFTYKNLREQAISMLGGMSIKDVDLSLLPIVQADINVKPTLKALIYSSYFKGTTNRQLFKLVRKYNEGGLPLLALKSISTFDLSTHVGLSRKPDGNAFNEAAQCMKGIIKHPEFHLSGIKFTNMVTFIIIVCSLCVIAFCVLSMEWLLSHFSF